MLLNANMPCILSSQNLGEGSIKLIMSLTMVYDYYVVLYHHSNTEGVTTATQIVISGTSTFWHGKWKYQGLFFC